MNKTKLIPQDGDLFAMIRNITGLDIIINEKSENYEIIACLTKITDNVGSLTYAVMGRLGKRFISSKIDKPTITYICRYGDYENYPEEIRMVKMPITKVSGTHYCRKSKEVDAIKVERDNLADLQNFTGGGTMIIPRDFTNTLGKYEFTDNNGIIRTVPEGFCIIRDENGKISVQDYRSFIRDYSKEIIDDDEKSEKSIDILSEDKAINEFEKLKNEIGAEKWNASETATFYGFFIHGWLGRVNKGIWQKQNDGEDDNVDWVKAELLFSSYPDGTKARAKSGKHWKKTPMGWKDDEGNITRYLSSDWTGEVLMPKG